jgi:hypothetical protein
VGLLSICCKIAALRFLSAKTHYAASKQSYRCSSWPVWEALPAIELLLEHLETMKAVYQEYPQPADPLPRSCALTLHALSLRCDLAISETLPEDTSLSIFIIPAFR